jgi:hypothetical protein
VFFLRRLSSPEREGLRPDLSGLQASVFRGGPSVGGAQWRVAVGEADIGVTPPKCQLAIRRNFAGVESADPTGKQLVVPYRLSGLSTAAGRLRGRSAGA